MTERTDLQWSTVEYYLSARLGTSYRLSHSSRRPVVLYEVNGSTCDIALFVEIEKNENPPRSRLPAIAIDRVEHRGNRMVRIRTTEPTLIRDFHDLAMAIADRIVNSGRPLAAAYAETIRAWTALMDQQRVAGLQRRLGLHGELIVLWGLATQFGWETALKAWTGPAAEEHDFAMSKYDIEVKTTASERRRHTINGLGQLHSTHAHPLWLVSVRLTRGGTGGSTLSESIDAVRNAAMSERIELGARVAKLVSGYELDDGVLDDERWTLLDAPLVLAADDIPTLSVDSKSIAASDRVLSVKYDVDLTGLPGAHGVPFDTSHFTLP